MQEESGPKERTQCNKLNIKDDIDILPPLMKGSMMTKIMK